MSSIDKRPDGQWRARWREYPGGPQKTKHFGRKVDAERFLTKVQHELLTGAYVDPRSAQTPLGDYMETWLDRMRPTWRPSTAAVVENSLRRHVLPVLGRRPLVAIKRADVEAWAAALVLPPVELAPATVATVRQHLGQLLTGAVDDGLLARNPAAGARMPRNEAERPRPVPGDVLEAITAALPSWARVAVPIGVGAGLRQAEATGLTIDRVEFLRRTLRVDRQLVTTSSAAPELAPPKTLTSVRAIPLAEFLADAVSAHVAEHGTGDLGLVLHLPDGRPVGRNRFGRIWRAARAKVGAESVDFHDLRHTFASTLLSEGVSVRAVSEWLGHASPKVTLDTYAHVMPVDDVRARSVLDEAFSGRSVTAARGPHTSHPLHGPPAGSAEDQVRTSDLRR